MIKEHYWVKILKNSIFLSYIRGNYNVKDLNDVIVEPYASSKDFVYKQFVTTVVCIVPVVMIE
jgi:hypothetical protein